LLLAKRSNVRHFHFTCPLATTSNRLWTLLFYYTMTYTWQIIIGGKHPPTFFVHSEGQTMTNMYLGVSFLSVLSIVRVLNIQRSKGDNNSNLNVAVIWRETEAAAIVASYGICYLPPSSSLRPAAIPYHTMTMKHEMTGGTH
jgi:hypothetical protein